MVALPRSHLDLLDRPLPAVLTTEMPDGRSQSTVVWCNREGDAILLNTMREFQKARNLATRPRATVAVLDPDDDGRWLEVRGSVELRDDEAQTHLDQLAVLYTGAAPYFGAVIDATFAEREHPVQIRLTPDAVVTETRGVRSDERTSSPLPARWGTRRDCVDDVRSPRPTQSSSIDP
jgi:PPOX class probable F420-dependent enzyme